MPREIPTKGAAKVMWRLWKAGFSSRPAITSPTSDGWIMLECWVQAAEVAPDGLVAFELELDDVLASDIRVSFRGSGARVERFGMPNPYAY